MDSLLPWFSRQCNAPREHAPEKLGSSECQTRSPLLTHFLARLQLAHVLPTEENFLLLFRCQQLKSCEEFMKVSAAGGLSGRAGQCGLR